MRTSGLGNSHHSHTDQTSPSSPSTAVARIPNRYPTPAVSAVDEQAQFFFNQLTFTKSSNLEILERLGDTHNPFICLPEDVTGPMPQHPPRSPKSANASPEKPVSEAPAPRTLPMSYATVAAAPPQWSFIRTSPTTTTTSASTSAHERTPTSDRLNSKQTLAVRNAFFELVAAQARLKTAGEGNTSTPSSTQETTVSEVDLEVTTNGAALLAAPTLKSARTPETVPTTSFPSTFANIEFLGIKHHPFPATPLFQLPIQLQLWTIEMQMMAQQQSAARTSNGVANTPLKERLSITRSVHTSTSATTPSSCSPSPAKIDLSNTVRFYSNNSQAAREASPEPANSAPPDAVLVNPAEANSSGSPVIGQENEDETRWSCKTHSGWLPTWGFNVMNKIGMFPDRVITWVNKKVMNFSEKNFANGVTTTIGFVATAWKVVGLIACTPFVAVTSVLSIPLSVASCIYDTCIA